jgi:hypothetical protein
MELLTRQKIRKFLTVKKSQLFLFSTLKIQFLKSSTYQFKKKYFFRIFKKIEKINFILYTFAAKKIFQLAKSQESFRFKKLATEAAPKSC